MSLEKYGDLQLGGKTYRLQFALLAFPALAARWGCSAIDEVVAQINQMQGTLTAAPRLADLIWAGTLRFHGNYPESIGPEVDRDQIFLALEDDGLDKFPHTMQRTFEIVMAQYPKAGLPQKKTPAKKKQRFRR